MGGSWKCINDISSYYVRYVTIVESKKNQALGAWCIWWHSNTVSTGLFPSRTCCSCPCVQGPPHTPCANIIPHTESGISEADTHLPVLHFPRTLIFVRSPIVLVAILTLTLFGVLQVCPSWSSSTAMLMLHISSCKRSLQVSALVHCVIEGEHE